MGFVGNTSGAGFSSSTGTFVSDGVSSATITTVTNNGTSVVTDSPGTLPYAVAADGTLTVTAADTLTGAVSPDGRFAVISGGTNAGSDIRLIFLLR